MGVLSSMPWSIWDKYSCVPGRGVCVFDPGTMMVATMGMTAASAGLSAAGTIAGGNTAKTAGLLQQKADKYKADQIRANEGSEIGAAQRQMLETQFKTKQLSSTLEARGTAGGINTDVGSPLAISKSIASRGSYQALMDLYNGQNRAVGLENEAKGAEFSGDVAAWAGEEQKKLSRINALATIAGGGANMAKTYGAYTYPTSSGQPGVRLS